MIRTLGVKVRQSGCGQLRRCTRIARGQRVVRIVGGCYRASLSWVFQSVCFQLSLPSTPALGRIVRPVLPSSVPVSQQVSPCRAAARAFASGSVTSGPTAPSVLLGRSRAASRANFSRLSAAFSFLSCWVPQVGHFQCFSRLSCWLTDTNSLTNVEVCCDAPRDVLSQEGGISQSTKESPPCAVDVPVHRSSVGGSDRFASAQVMDYFSGPAHGL